MMACSAVKSRRVRVGTALVAVGIVATSFANPLRANAIDTPVECTHPVWTTSTPDDMRNFGEYIVHNNMWNADGYEVTQSVAACSAAKWNVTTRADDTSKDGAVKTYPNVHKDYHDWSTGAEPRLSSFTNITSKFAATSPHVGIYNVAYDIWLDGVPGNREVMIWTENFNQRPAGDVVQGDLLLSGYNWTLWATGDNSILTFVPRAPLSAGQLDLKVMLNYLVSQRKVRIAATIGQICYGVEVVSTNAKSAKFSITDFSISDSRR